jgi:HK97 family phage major capsid protein
MKRMQALRERRAEFAKNLRNLLDLNPGNAWNDDCQRQYDEGAAEIGRIEGELQREQQLLDIAAQVAAESRNGGQPAGNPDGDEPTFIQLLNRWLRGGDGALNAADWKRVRNTMSTTTAGEGGYAVPTEVASSLINAMKDFGGMRQAATIISTDSGAPINFPSSDGTSETGELLAENTAAADLDPSFGVVSLATYKYSSKVVAVPIELLQDSAVDVEAFVRQRLAERLGRITNTHYTTGTGSSQPKGVVTGATSGKTGTTGQTASVIYEDLVDLVHAVDPAYRRSLKCRFMMNDASIKIIRKLKDSAGRPIWSPSYDAGLTAGQPELLLGYPIISNADVATMAANAKSILFGDMSKYIIRDVMNVTLFRFEDSAYAKKGQVGFLAFLRTTGNLLDTASVKYYANSAT